MIEALPTLGPLFADPAFRNWVTQILLIWILIGYMPEELEKDGVTKRVWRWGGVVRAFIQQSVETRELRSDVRTLIKEFRSFAVNGRIADSDRPPPSHVPIPAPRVSHASCSGE